MCFGKNFFPDSLCPSLRAFIWFCKLATRRRSLSCFGRFSGGGLESVVLATFFRFGNIFEQSILFSYMAAYGATPLPTNSLKQLFCLWLGPWSQLCDNFCTTPKPKKCHSFPLKATHQLIATKTIWGGCRTIFRALNPGGGILTLNPKP